MFRRPRVPITITAVLLAALTIAGRGSTAEGDAGGDGWSYKSGDGETELTG